MFLSKHVIVKSKGKYVHCGAENVRPGVSNTHVDVVNEVDITVLPANTANQHVVHPTLESMSICPIEQQHNDRVQGVVLFVACNKAHGKIATLKHGVVSVKQSDVLGDVCILMGHWCYFDISFFHPWIDKQRLFCSG